MPKIRKNGNGFDTVSNYEMMKWFAEYSAEDFKSAFRGIEEVREQRMLNCLNILIDENAARENVNYIELPIVQACKNIANDFSADARANFSAEQLYALIKLEYAAMKEKNTFNEIFASQYGEDKLEKNNDAYVDYKYAHEFNNMLDDIPSMIKRLNDGDRFYRGSSNAYKDIKRRLAAVNKVLENAFTDKKWDVFDHTVQDVDLNKFDRLNIYLELESINQAMEKYIADREKTEISEPQNSYKGRRISIMREVQARLQVKIKVFRDNFQIGTQDLNEGLEANIDNLKKNLVKNFDAAHYAGLKGCEDINRGNNIKHGNVYVNAATDKYKNAFQMEALSGLNGKKNITEEMADGYVEIANSNYERVFDNHKLCPEINDIVNNPKIGCQLSNDADFNKSMKRAMGKTLRTFRRNAGMRPGAKVENSQGESYEPEKIQKNTNVMAYAPHDFVKIVAPVKKFDDERTFRGVVTKVYRDMHIKYEAGERQLRQNKKEELDNNIINTVIANNTEENNELNLNM